MSAANKKGLKLAVLSLIGIVGLTACSSDELFSKPTDYEDPIVAIEDADGKHTDDIHHNILSIIYDAMHEGNLTSKVLDEALYRYAASIFGTYNKITRAEGSQEITLQEAAEDVEAGGDFAKANEFIKAHKAYWNYNDQGEHVNDEGQVIADDTNFVPGNTEREHVRSKWSAIEDRIATNMYNRISGGSYTTKHFFSESDFLRKLHENGEKVNYVKDLTKVIIPYTVEKEDIFEEFEDFNGQMQTALHRAYYQDGENFTYIEDVVIPEVYNDLLVEQYLLDEEVAAVRNSRARKINVIKIEKYSSFTNNADLLVKELVKEIYDVNQFAATDTFVRTDADEIENAGKGLFEKYALVSKGLYDEIAADAEASAIVQRLQAKASDVYQVETFSGINYYKNTTYGDLVEDYKDVKEVTDWNLLDESKFATFTASGTRTVEEGFEQQKIDIMQSQNITKGWYIQSSTPSLDSKGEINDRLFKLSVANAKIEIGDGADAALVAANKEALKNSDRFVYSADSGWSIRSREEANAVENKFLCSINGAFYLRFEGQYTSDDWMNDIVYDDGSAYYIVQVLEAAKDSKLRNLDGSNYAASRGQSFMDSIIDEIAKHVGETGSYATLSKNHWLEKMDLKYHDQKIYDYFKANYPDLFDEE